MIGAAYSQSVGGNVSASYAIDITPSGLDVEAPNGGYQSPIIRANPVNGVGPFDFTWSVTTPLVSLENAIDSGEDTFTRITTSGFAPDIVEGVLTCNCIDTGNGNTPTQSSINFKIQFV